MKKLLALLLALSLCAVMLTACGSTSASTSDDASASQSAADAGEMKLATDGILTMGTNAAFPPYEYYEGEDIVGIDADIAAAIADKLGLQLEIVDMDFGSLIAAVQSGKIDVSLAGMTVNEERLENVNFSTSYATGVQVIIVPEGSDITSPDDLEGKLIGVQENTTGHIYCADDYGEENVVAYTNGATAVQALLQGQVDCVVIDNEPAKSFVAANDGLVILDTEYVTEDYAIAVAKDNDALLDAINAALDELTQDGTIQGILDQYINAD
jgi:polar amino acid transport system substrate-binding protein